LKEDDMSMTQTEARTTWRIDPAHSNIEFSVRHLMISTVKGRFTGVDGTVTIDDAHPANPDVNVTIDASTVDTRDPQRDGHLRSADFLDVDKFPHLTFRGTRIADRKGDAFALVGDLTIHGVTREIALHVTEEGRVKDPWGGERMGFSATTKINRKDYGLTWNQALETGGVIVGDEVKIAIDLEFLKS
jgi:polyisoprenoid-binding protein YceI